MINSTKCFTVLRRSSIHLFVLFLLTFAPRLYGQFMPLDSIRLINAIDKLFKQYKTPDCAVLVTRNNSIIFQFDRNLENHGKNYIIGSCSKSFTALALLQLVDAGKVALDTPVKKYLPWFLLKDSVQSRKITVRHLLNQTSGFKYSDGYAFVDFSKTDKIVFENKMAIWLKDIELKWAPGKAFNYSNLNSALAGLIISNVSGDSYASYLKKNVLSKIGMTNTVVRIDESRPDAIVPGYQNIFNLFTYRKYVDYSDFIVPEGYISSNTADLSKYLQCMQNMCRTRSGEALLTSDSYKQLTTPLQDGYAMGWMGSDISFIKTFAQKYGLSFLYHTGVIENYNAVLALDTVKKINIIVLSNTCSMESNLEVLKIILAAVNNFPYASGSSKEYFVRIALLILFILLTGGLLYNAYVWKKFRFKMGVTLNPKALIRLFTGIVFSVAPLIIVPQINNISLRDLTDFFPDLGYGLVAIATLGLLSSLIRYLATNAKHSVRKQSF